MGTFDFRSDTVTLPTPEMMQAIATAALGDAARGDDPTVNALEHLVCRLTGKSQALFLPSGVMANLAALIAHECRGGEVIVEESSHVYNAEWGGLSVVAAAVARPVCGACGVMAPDDIGASIRRGGSSGRVPTRLICIENTHNAAGGTVLPLENLCAIHAVAQQAGVPVHMDGARLFNAAAYLDVPVERICRHADSVWFSVCKALGAPVGAVLAGGDEFMHRARRAARMLGGGMRQAGLLAAPAIVALRDPMPRHRRDHRLAARLAEGLERIDETLVAARDVQTNIVNCHVGRYAGDAWDIAGELAVRGVRVNGARGRIRFVTHAQVDEHAVDGAVAAMAEVLRGRLRP